MASCCSFGDIFTAFQDNFGTRLFYRLSFLSLALIVTIALPVLPSTLAANPVAFAISSTTHNGTGICKSMDIRNTLAAFEGLKGCRVVEGFLQILLFDSLNETDLYDITFPELVEITDYLLLYRVNGLRSIGQLFPNLAVIRGQNLFFSYSLIIFEMSTLQEIALHSLMNITRGYVRIDKNPSLCFVNSVDWNHIITETVDEEGQNFIQSIKPENECPLCSEDCPKKSDKHLCWNKKHCQKVCPSHCRVCNDRGDCCGSKCIGGCDTFNANNCTVCRNFTLGVGRDMTCIDHCPDGFVEYLNRRCVTPQECVNTTHIKSDVNDGTFTADETYKVFRKTCVLHCPAKYMTNSSGYCVECEGRCEKVCAGLNVDSISVAKQLRGCTIIDGGLEIQIRGGRNVVSELEENLSMIEEITGYLKVVRSFPLMSLSFLKNLKRIRGKKLENHKYAFVVLDNQNLQELWNFTNRPFKIDKGRLFFHFNPKLCLYKIIELQNITGLSPFIDLEVANNSNGDKIACNVTEMNVTVINHNQGVQLTWKQFDLDDQRKLLGYIVYSIEAPYRNITLYDGRDACGGDGWRVDDVEATEEGLTEITHPLTNLKAYTQYAFYVKTYTIATEINGAQSAIQYFRTSPSEPSSPQNLFIYILSSNEIEIKWEPPLYPNGNVNHYIVQGRRHIDMLMDNERDYCEIFPVYRPQLPTTIRPSIFTNATNTSDFCQCDDKKQPKSKIDERVQENRINFENELHNEVYVKRKPNHVVAMTRKRREILTFPVDKKVESNKNNNGIFNETFEGEDGTQIYNSFSFVVSGTKFRIGNLLHYASYDIFVSACREREESDEADAVFCSSTSIKTGRTQLREQADTIGPIHLKNQTTDSVTIAWDEPRFPNGIIFAYMIEYKRLDIANSTPNSMCINRNAYNQTRLYQIRQLSPGNYSLRVSAYTSAQRGGYSPKLYFYIESPQRLSLTLGLPITLVILITLVAGVVYFWLRQRDKKDMIMIPRVNPEYMHSVYIADEWEIPREKISYKQEDALGQGSFGMVYAGMAYDVKGQTQVRCAIKTVNEHATDRERIEFLNEASVMKAFDTSHVVRLLGVVSKGQPTLVIMELMANGDLKSYLRSHRPDADTPSRRTPPSLRQILQMAIEIADGMAYLAAKKFVHRDLAARNCMVSEDLTVKIGDFGMTRDIYETDYYRKGTKGLLPVRWMAPESLQDGVFTSHSDVWSYGVVLWEMATLGSQPYQGLSNDQVLRYVIGGGTMEKPENCPEMLFRLMKWCWSPKPSHRPSFLQLCSELLDHADSNFAQISFYHSPAGLEAQNMRPTPSPSQDDASTPLRVDSEEEMEESSPFAAAAAATTAGSEDSDEELGIDSQPPVPPQPLARHHRSRYIGRGPKGATTNGFIGCAPDSVEATQC